VNYLWPFEVAAGCDVNVFRSRYPTLGMMGGIDKRALAAGPDAIDAELDRIWPAVEAGRYIPELDHGIPDDVSWTNYLHYAKQMKKRILGG
jgi:uroporphyrinogen decarboxylase